MVWEGRSREASPDPDSSVVTNPVESPSRMCRSGLRPISGVFADERANSNGVSVRSQRPSTENASKTLPGAVPPKS